MSAVRRGGSADSIPEDLDQLFDGRGFRLAQALLAGEPFPHQKVSKELQINRRVGERRIDTGPQAGSRRQFGESLGQLSEAMREMAIAKFGDVDVSAASSWDFS